MMRRAKAKVAELKKLLDSKPFKATKTHLVRTNIIPTIGLLGLGSTAIYASLHTKEPELSLENIYDMSKELVQSCNTSDTSTLVQSLLEGIKVNNSQTVEERLKDLETVQFQFTKRQFELLINIVAARGRAHILDIMVGYFGEKAVKSIPRANKLLSHASRYEIEALCAPFFQYANTPAAGLFNPGTMRAALTYAEDNVRNSQPQLVTSGSDFIDDMTAVPSYLREYRDNYCFYDDSILKKYQNTLVIPTDDPTSRKFLETFLEYLKKEAARSGKPVTASCILTGGHYTSFDIQVKNEGNNPEATVIYFDSTGCSSFVTQHYTGRNRQYVTKDFTSYYQILRHHFPKLKLYSSDSRLQVQGHGCPIFSVFRTIQGIEADKTLFQLPQYQDRYSENLLFDYAKDHTEQHNTLDRYVLLEPDKNDKNVPVEYLYHYNQFCVPASMNVAKCYEKDIDKPDFESQDVGYQLVDPNSAEATPENPDISKVIDDTSHDAVLVKYVQTPIILEGQLGLTSEIAYCKEKDSARYQEFTSPMFFNGSKTTPEKVINDHAKVFTTKEGKEKRLNLLPPMLAARFGFQQAQSLVNKSPKEIRMMREEFQYSQGLHKQIKPNSVK